MTTVASQRWFIVMALIGLLAAGVTAWRMWPTTTPREFVQRGLAAVARQDWPEVARAADGLKGQPEFVSEEHLLRGISLLKSGQPVGALKEFTRLEPTGEIRELALLSTGEAFYRVNRLTDAGRIFATLSAEQPGHVEAHRWLAAIAYDLGDMNRAMDELDIVIRLAPEDYRPHILKGQMLFDLERFADATIEYALAVDADPPKLILEEVLPALARSHMANREYPEALKMLARAPRTALILALEAGCRLSLGNTKTAQTLLNESQELDPQQPEMLRLLGRMELDAGHPEAAETAFRTVLDHDPQDHETRHQLAQALRLVGNTTEAENEARRSARTIELKTQLAQLTLDAISHPDDADVRERMAWLCEELEKPRLVAMWRNAAAACRQATAMPLNQLPGSLSSPRGKP